MKKFNLVYLITTFIVSFGLGIIFKDHYLLGSITLYLGFVEILLMSQGKWYEKFVGIFETLFSTTVFILSSMYGSIFFTLFIYLPIAIFSIINWKKNEKESIVQLNKMDLKTSIITVFLVVIGTLIVSSLLTLIPTQKLAFWDSLNNILNISGILLIGLRYKEGWIVWIINSVTELTTWILALQNGYSNNAILMIFTCIFYLGLNTWGLKSFINLRKKQENTNKNLSF
ncbi:MAG: nicotinamide mononucleotide transporter [Erysipelotrichaceae bacterium]|nr:nicotinamide mononucleotide transporter [Erysipelotrichaceae bacterium]